MKRPNLKLPTNSKIIIMNLEFKELNPNARAIPCLNWPTTITSVRCSCCQKQRSDTGYESRFHFITHED